MTFPKYEIPVKQTRLDTKGTDGPLRTEERVIGLLHSEVCIDQKCVKALQLSVVDHCNWSNSFEQNNH